MLVTTGFVQRAWLLAAYISLPIMASSIVTSRQTSTSSIDCSLPSTNGTTFTSTNGGIFDILCDLDYYGGDLRATHADTFNDCIQSCEADPDCIDVSYDVGGNVCYMKNQLAMSTPRVAVGIWTARKQTVLVTCVDNQSNGTVYTSAQGSFQILCGVDYAGGDMAALTEGSFSKCMDACDAKEGCLVVSYNNDQCYMKSQLNPLSSNLAVWTGKKIIQSVTNTGAAADDGTATSLSNGTIFTAPSGKKYQIILGQEYPGPDLKAIDSKSFQDCITQCDSTPSCIDISYVGPGCYMKANVGTLQDAPWVSTAVIVNPTIKSPLTCTNNAFNGTKFSTTAGNDYEILCHFDYYGSDLNMVWVDTFEQCLDKCDATIGCVDVSYSGTACYMKNSATTLTAADWVWNALYIGKTADVSSSASSTTPSSTSSSTSTLSPSTSVPTPSTCSSDATGKFLPSQDSDIDRSSIDRLSLSTSIVLNYAEEPGNRALQLDVNLVKGAILLENTNRVTSVTCASGPTLNVQFSSASDMSAALQTWPSTGYLLVTYENGCNLDTARGFWEVQGTQTPTSAAPLTVVFNVLERNMTQIATQLTILYGTVDNGQETFTSTSTGVAPDVTMPPNVACESSSATPASVTSSSSSSPPTSSSTGSSDAERPLPTSLESLTPAARELFDFLEANIKVDAMGNLNAYIPPQTVTEIPVAPYNPDDVATQQALEAKLQDAGLLSPSDLTSEASAGLQGTCASPGAVVKRSLLQVPRRHGRDFRGRNNPQQTRTIRELEKLYARIDSDQAWDIACDDTTTDLLGAFNELAGKTLEGVCAGKSLYDNRDAIHCLFSGCPSTQTQVTYIVTKTTTYDFNYAWKVNMGLGPGSTLQAQGANKAVSCVNCGFSVSSISFSGKIVASVTQGVLTLQSAQVTPGVIGVANMVVRLQSDGPWSGKWNYVFQTNKLGDIALDSAFKISPSVLLGLGIDYATDSAVDVTGGATFSLNNAAATINIANRHIDSQQGWNPAVSFTLPTFKTGSGVTLKPNMRWMVQLDVNVYDMIQITPTITSQTVVGLNSVYSFTNGICPANNLAVSSYVNTANYISVGDGSGPMNLYNGQSGHVDQCFAVPGIMPSPAEVSSLQAVGGDFCTSFIGYRAPTKTSTAWSTSTVPSTVSTFITTSVPVTTTVTKTLSLSNDVYSTTTVAATTVTVTKAGGVPNFSLQNFKRDIATAMPSATLDARAASTPAMLVDWDATKIAFACKQIATGTATATVTSTATSTSGSVSSTGTITVNQNGPLVTYTYTAGSTRYMGLTTVSTASPAATATVCPPSTQNSCFRIKCHGAPWVEGQYVSYGDYGGFNPMRPGYSYTTWYLTSTGKLIGYIPSSGKSVVMGSPTSYLTSTPGEVLGLDITTYGSSGWTLATCKKDADPCSNGLTCNIGTDRVGMSLQPPQFQRYSSLSGLGNMPGYLQNSFRFAWGTDGNGGYAGWTAVSFTYEDAPCPC